MGRGKHYSLNDFREYVFKEILGKRILTQQSKEIDLILRNIYQSIMAKTSTINLALKDHKLIVIDHHMGHLVVHRIDEIVNSMLDHLENDDKPIVTIRPS